MKLTAKKIWNAGPALERLLAQPIPFKTSLALSHLGRKVREESDFIEKERRKLIASYGDPNQVPKEKTAEFLAAFDTMLGEEMVLQDCEAVALPQTVLERLEIAAGDILALEGLVTFGE